MAASTPASRNIIQDIINNLRFDCTTLKSCSRVSRDFSAYTRPHLFHLIRGISIKIESCYSIDALISISRHVRAVRLSNDDLFNATMPLIISSFDHLEHICILGYVNLSALPGDMIKALTCQRSLVTSLELNAVDYTDIRILNQFLQPYLGLRKLGLLNMRFDMRAYSVGKTGASGPKPQPMELSLHAGTLLRPFLYPHSPASLNRLQKLSVSALFMEDFMSLALVIRLAPNLRELHLRGLQKDSRWFKPKPLDLSSIEVVSFNLFEANEEFEQHLHPGLILAWWIESFRSGVALRSITMTVQVNTTENGLINARLWEWFDAILGSLGTIKAVRGIIRGEKGHVLKKMIDNKCNRLTVRGLMEIRVNGPQRKGE
ncbi:uncharacterized protein BT62DRAFT_995681 [Guyanagaster necrorhizus]|uniref:Uncharacterized protein n=1 Tax=Guyanagaster necrorhizus TaxID=856835 RepID=A0A9P7VPX4_9AGAR|nr:uncharacterized protein BT62DRAFT_995681 [Guyanagaster necrorhizus MCA 3950]KAG7443876.1 hypothetical protein BT62DRAFT_995681 [Guyanagaster necrorhizus MCA 3950]